MRFRRIREVRKAVTAAIWSGILVSAPGSIAVSQYPPPAPAKFDEFRITWPADEMARLDRFALQLSSNRDLQGLIVGHNQSDLGGGWLLRSAYGYVNYLVNKRGIEASRISAVEGETVRGIDFEFWLLPTGAVFPGPLRKPEPEPMSPKRFDGVSLGEEWPCVGEVLELYKLDDALRFFGEALRQQSRTKAWIVVHPRVREPRATALRTIDASRDLLIKDYGITSDRVLTAIGPQYSSMCTVVKLWIAPSSSVRPDEAAYYSQLMDEAEQTEYTVRRVEFTGNTHIRDNILRRRFVQQGGDVFSRRLLVQSLKNFSELKMVYPVTLNDVEFRLDREDRLMDFTIYFRERPPVRRGSKIH